MFGFLFGTLCLFGLVGLARHAACGPRHGCHGGHGGWRRHRRPRGAAFGRAAGEVFKRRLRIDEDQEVIVDHAIRDAQAALEELSTELGETRKTLADALRGETVDDGALAGAFARHDDALGRARRQVVSAMKQVHAVLEPDQRKLAADWLGAGGGWWS